MPCLATHAVIDELDDDCTPFPLDSMEGLNALEESWLTLVVRSNWYVIFFVNVV